MSNRQRRQELEGSPQAGTNPVRVGCIEYLTARPLWQGLGDHPRLFSLKFSVPSEVSSWLHSGEVDLALVSSIEYGPGYRIVPGVAVTSMGSVASLAAFSSKPLTEVKTVALDTSSRTAAALMRILCSDWFDIEPEFVSMRPNLSAMLQRCDAALLIGDNTLFVDHVGMGLHKYDLCDEWRGLNRPSLRIRVLGRLARCPDPSTLAGFARFKPSRGYRTRRHSLRPLPRQRDPRRLQRRIPAQKHPVPL